MKRLMAPMRRGIGRPPCRTVSSRMRALTAASALGLTETPISLVALRRKNRKPSSPCLVEGTTPDLVALTLSFSVPSMNCAAALKTLPPARSLPT
jgi:hypothetical protein